jgi:hypothetical protein
MRSLNEHIAKQVKSNLFYRVMDEELLAVTVMKYLKSK